MATTNRRRVSVNGIVSNIVYSETQAAKPITSMVVAGKAMP
jgi:hypothetical protein